MSKQRTDAGAGAANAASTSALYDSISSPATRETVESIVVAVILAFLFRGFIAEAFVIPTGSMAPTLQGSHKDLECPECGYRYRTGASSENPDAHHQSDVIATTCPICRYIRPVDTASDRNDSTFTGDRILVSKFAYELGDPRRWDVIVFKYPGNAKQNYIKRLVGLPNETLKIFHGDVYVRREGEQQYQIARKEDPKKQLAMLQLVDDTQHVAGSLAEAGWPSRWQTWPAEVLGRAWSRTCENDSQGFDIAGGDSGPAWMRYRHFVPRDVDWHELGDGILPERIADWQGQLISDFYAYNGYITKSRERVSNGMHWVGDLAVEYDVQTDGGTGAILLDLVEGGVHYQCRIDLATGRAELSIPDGSVEFTDSAGPGEVRTAQTAVRGAGNYALRLSNVDDQVRLWVNDRLVEFDGPTTYDPGPNVQPNWTPADPLDLAPAGIAADGCSLHVQRARIYRDVYYIAALSRNNDDSEYKDRPWGPDSIVEIFGDPRRWSSSGIFESRRDIDFTLAANEFFPMGDNSPQSKDARLWDVDFPHENNVDRELLTGKALLIYWPHAWKSPIPFLPNFQRMGLIR